MGSTAFFKERRDAEKLSLKRNCQFLKWFK